ncbi:hypothetical protein N9P38_00070 [Flavobacteriales bacterium]|nr:hypothetical protein [Flavobacteriales bacterium]MDB4088343.1 hypothetical protein [Flavobacteriales bacterium]
MRITFLIITLLIFSCTSNSDKPSTDINGIEVSNSEIEEVKNSEEQSEHVFPHLYEMDLSKALLDDNSFNNIHELIKICIKLEKIKLSIEEIHESRELFMNQLDKTMNEASNIGGETQSFFDEYLQPLNPLVDITFDVHKEEEFKIGLNQIKVYLGNFYKLFPLTEQ